MQMFSPLGTSSCNLHISLNLERGRFNSETSIPPPTSRSSSFWCFDIFTNCNNAQGSIPSSVSSCRAWLDCQVSSKAHYWSCRSHRGCQTKIRREKSHFRKVVRSSYGLPARRQHSNVTLLGTIPSMYGEGRTLSSDR